MDNFKAFTLLAIIFLSLIVGMNSLSNRRQDEIIFGTVDNMTELIESDARQIEISQKITEILSVIGVEIRELKSLDK